MVYIKEESISTYSKIKVYYFIFADGSQMTIKSPDNFNESYFKSSGLLTLGLTGAGQFCAYFKLPDSNECQIKLYTDLGGQKNFWYCNVAGEKIDRFYLSGGKTWGIHANGDYTDFFNFSECGSFTEYTILFRYEPMYLKQSSNFFYCFNKQTKTIDRFLPGALDQVVWATFPAELDIFGADCIFSSDDYSIIETYYHSTDPENYSRIFCTDNNGKILHEMEGGILHYIVL